MAASGNIAEQRGPGAAPPRAWWTGSVTDRQPLVEQLLPGTAVGRRPLHQPESR
ncbi:hypothetical protein [Kitasatospora griseola]|uniref:hypothetical protein n=1 Tax=Kitasatospora griseola TaxID=2064 RepID=UPI001670E543|nr:hypothetical protein [Kitasatospora griseola]